LLWIETGEASAIRFDAVPKLSYTEGVLRRTLPTLAAGALALCLVLGLVACGGVASALDPVAAAAGKSADAGSVKVTIDASIAAGSVDGSIHAVGAFDKSNGELTLDASNLLQSLNMPGASSANGQVKVITATEDGHPVVYVNIPSLATYLPGGMAWIKADVDKAASLAGGNAGSMLGLAGQSPAKILDLLSGAGTVTTVGTDSIDGAQVTHYRANVDLVKALEQQGVPAPTVQALIATGASTELPIDVWIGVDDGLVHRVAVAYDSTVNGQHVAVKTTMTMSDWGTDVSVDLPPADQVFDATAFAAKLRKS
jgi:hypothetical protein